VNPLEGVLIVDKPSGPTSHDVVEEVRRFTRPLRVGHTGTLDPLATGVLPLCIGRATRLARFLAATTKVYAGVMRLGVVTDTYDAAGRVIGGRPAEGISGSAVREAAARFVGPMMQAPPAYSARKVNGLPMHRLARRGRDVALKPAPVTIFRFDIVEVAGGSVCFEAETSPGTYIRSLAHDLGEVLGCGAHLERLRRLASGSFVARQAHSMDSIRARGLQESLGEIIIPLRLIDLGLPTARATRDGAAAMRNGRALTSRDLADGWLDAASAPGGAGPGPVRVEDAEGNLLGVAVPGTTRGGDPYKKPEVVLASSGSLPARG
jgi:tRNA pseudouridine55 synthase